MEQSKSSRTICMKSILTQWSSRYLLKIYVTIAYFEHICLYSGLQRNFSLYSMCYQKFSKHIHSLGCGIHLSPVTLRIDIKVRLLYVYVYGWKRFLLWTDSGVSNWNDIWSLKKKNLVQLRKVHEKRNNATISPLAACCLWVPNSTAQRCPSNAQCFPNCVQINHGIGSCGGNILEGKFPQAFWRPVLG